MARLKDKVAIILGASDARSMGAATARRFAAEGAKLVLGARRQDAVAEIAREVGGVAVACDITKEADIAAMVQAALDHYGKLDVAINYAGISFNEPILESTPETLRAASDVHFVGSTLFIKHAAKAMKDGGSIITTSTLTAIVAPPGMAAYAGTKKGVDQVVRIAAVELGPKNIRVNSIAPGLTRSAMTEAYFEMEPVLKAFLREMPLGRFPSVEDIANAALWLASDEAFTTGQVIDITGGQSLKRIPTAEDMGG